jgi:hypothetical protein
MIDRFADYLSRYAGMKGTPVMSRVLHEFEQAVMLDPRAYFLCDFDTLKALAKAIEPVPGLSFAQQWELCCAPVRYRIPKELDFFTELAAHMNGSVAITQNRIYQGMLRELTPASVVFDNLKHINDIPPSSPKLDDRDDVSMPSADRWVNLIPQPKRVMRPETILFQYESMHRMASVYLWLHYRHPRVYTSGAVAWACKQRLETVMQNVLLQRVNHKDNKPRSNSR